MRGTNITISSTRTGQVLADPPLQTALTRLTDTLLAGNRRGYAALADSDCACAITPSALKNIR